MKVFPSRWHVAFHVWRLGTPWIGGRKWYQYIDFGSGLTTTRWSAGDAYLRTNSFLSFLDHSDLLNSRDVVVDIGSNAGLFSLVAAQKCMRVYGVELDPCFYRQAEFMKQWWSSQGKCVDNVSFVHGNINDHLDLVSQATVVFASKVLYHSLLGTALEKLMTAIENGHPRLILMQGHTVRGEFGQDKGMNQLVANHGFRYRLAEDVPEFPIAIGTR